MRSSFTLISIVTVVLGALPSCKTQQTGWAYNDTKWIGITSDVDMPKAARKYLDGLLYIPGGTFTMGNDEPLEFTDKDSTLLPPAMSRRITVFDFYLSDHEVTNAEYREFVNWVRDSVAMTVLAEKDPSWYSDKGKHRLNWTRRPEIWIRDSFQLDGLLEDKPGRQKKLRTEKLAYTWITDTSIQSINIYPDTLSFVKYASYLSSEPGTRYYFCHPAYNDFPVVGVSWQQAMAYCHWLTWQVEKEYPPEPQDTKRLGDHAKAAFRLPTEKEWEYAAKSFGYSTKESTILEGPRTYPWDGLMLTDNTANYLCNFGNIIDRNGLYAKYYINDGSFLPAKVKSYPANDFKLYDMAGNVAEWTMDRMEPDTSLLFTYVNTGNDGDPIYHFDEPAISEEQLAERHFMDSLRKSTRILPSDNYDKALEKIKARNHAYTAYALHKNWKRVNYLKREFLIAFYSGRSFDTLTANLQYMDSAYGKELKRVAENELQAAQVLARQNNPRIVKGGSWADGMAYIMCANREAFSENRSSCRIGFRVALPMVYRRKK